MIQRRDDVVALDDSHTGVEHRDTEEDVLHTKEIGQVFIFLSNIFPLHLVEANHWLSFSFIPVFPNNGDQYTIKTVNQSPVKHAHPSTAWEKAFDSEALVTDDKDRVKEGKQYKCNPSIPTWQSCIPVRIVHCLQNIITNRLSKVITISHCDIRCVGQHNIEQTKVRTKEED